MTVKVDEIVPYKNGIGNRGDQNLNIEVICATNFEITKRVNERLAKGWRILQPIQNSGYTPIGTALFFVVLGKDWSKEGEYERL